MSAPHCPACDARPALLRQQGEHESFRCTRCGGFWVPAATLAALARRADEFRLPPDDAEAALRRPGTAGPVRYRPCPGCGELMNRQNYARVSGVVVDECRAHGTWFDAEELHRVLDFIRAGGFDKKRAREVEEFRERERKARLAEALADRRPAYGPDLRPMDTDYWPVIAAAAVIGELLD